MKKIGACILYKGEEKQYSILITLKQRIKSKNKKEEIESLIYIYTPILEST